MEAPPRVSVTGRTRSVKDVPVAGPFGRSALLLLALVVLGMVAIMSLAVGAESLSPATVWHELWHDTGSEAGSIVRGLRLDRTIVGVCVGAALGLAGALMQALTRNPLADPGLLGVTAGAAAAVVTGLTVFGLTAPSQYLWLSLVGAGVASVAVYLLGAGASPARLVLAGAAITAVLTSYVNGLTMLNQESYDAYRFWVVGTLVNRDLGVLAQAGPFLVVGAVLGLLLAGALNAVALGDDASRALGVAALRTRVLTAIAITCLCGAATAITGPIGFIGLTVPHIARAVVGPDQRWVLPFSMVFAAIILLFADVVGRVLVSGELQIGIMTAVVGVPVFVWLVRRRKMAEL